MQRIIPHSNVKQFKYLKVLTQEFHVKVDLLFINEIAEMFTAELTDEEKVRCSICQSNKIYCYVNHVIQISVLIALFFFFTNE